jgi:hypothetical protein
VTHLFSRTDLARRVSARLADPAALGASLADVDPPTALSGWLARLMLLHGVPINYLVPDEGMLPRESIRFFYVDMNWVDALIDGAFSIGRNVTAGGDSASHAVDRAVHPKLRDAVRAAAPSVRAAAFGVEPPAPALRVVSGFLLRSKVVQEHRGLGVNAYPDGGTPKDPTVTMLTVLRLEQLGPKSDTILCLVDGDAVQFDVHEPPEALHYGVQLGGAPSKKVSLFTRGADGATISFAGDPVEVPNFDQCFRTTAPRTIRMNAASGAIAQLLLTSVGAGSGIDPNDPYLDSAEMGFEMTEGVGMVSFGRGGQST